MGVVLSAGASLDWWRRTSGRADYTDLIREAEHVAVGSGGITFLPYLNGERTPHADADARGVFLGMHAGIERGHMTRAVLEGVSYALKDSLDLMNPLGVNPVQAVAVGGGAGSPVWLQILSDVLNLKLRTVGPSEGAPLGAAMLAATGHGEFCSPRDAVESWLFDLETIEPDPSVLEQYAIGYDRYVSLYPLLKPVFTSNV
jgi:xylulokinase